MATVSEVMQDSLADIIVAGAESSIEADESQAFIRHLNDFMAELEADGVALGYTVVSNVSDAVTVAAGALGAIKAVMAVRMAPMFGVAPSPELHARAALGVNRLLRMGMTIVPTSMPAGLPIGSGHDYTAPLYPVCDE